MVFIGANFGDGPVLLGHHPRILNRPGLAFIYGIERGREFHFSCGEGPFIELDISPEYHFVVAHF